MLVEEDEGANESTDEDAAADSQEGEYEYDEADAEGAEPKKELDMVWLATMLDWLSRPEMNAAEEDDSAALAEAVAVSETNVSVPLMTFSTPEAEGEGVISLDQPVDVLEALRSELMREAEVSAKREEADSEPAESVLDAEADSEDDDAAAKGACTRERDQGDMSACEAFEVERWNVRK